MIEQLAAFLLMSLFMSMLALPVVGMCGLVMDGIRHEQESNELFNMLSVFVISFAVAQLLISLEIYY